MTFFYREGFDLMKSTLLPFNTYLTTGGRRIVCSPDVLVKLCHSLDNSLESIYAYWFKHRGVNNESVNDCIAVALSKIHKQIDDAFDAYHKMDLFLTKGILIQ